MDSGDEWLLEAIVDYLKGPMYIIPLMGFIDQECMIFTPEDENKFQYTTTHEKFKVLVDNLLTDFLGELGVSPEAFYAQVSKAQNADRLTSFVVQTILTVDDFFMFKAMMVKRNIDLTNQVLAAFENRVMSPAAVKSASKSQLKDESHHVDKVVQLSKEEVERLRGMRSAMRSLQVEDEDDALAVAIAASLRDSARADTELAEVNQAIALSLALEAERQRMLAEAESATLRAALAAKGAAFEAELEKLRAALAAKGTATEQELAAMRAVLQAKGFDAAEASLAAVRALLTATGSAVDHEVAALKESLAKQGVSSKVLEAEVAALTAALVVRSSDSTVVAARAADAATTAATPTKSASFPASKATFGAGSGPNKPPVALASACPAKPAAANGSAAALPVSTTPLPPVKAGDSSSMASAITADEGWASLTSSASRFTPAPINGVTSSKVPAPEELYALAVGATSDFKSVNAVRSKAAGYKSSGNPSSTASLESIRAAAQAAASTQKNIAAAAGQDQKVWLEQQKQKLVAAKKAERDAEMEAYLKQIANRERGWTGQAEAKGVAAPIAGTDTDAKRAALREKLASKMLQDMMHKA